MPFSLTDLLYGIVVPALLAGITIAVLHRFGPGEIFKRSAATVALVAGFLAGYGLLGLGPWQPAAHWHWLPWAVLLSLAESACAANVERLSPIAPNGYRVRVKAVHPVAAFRPRAERLRTIVPL